MFSDTLNLQNSALDNIKQYAFYEAVDERRSEEDRHAEILDDTEPGPNS